MTEKRTVRLLVEMPDPGDTCNWCEMTARGRGGILGCRLGFLVDNTRGADRKCARPRPAECRAAEVTSG